MGKKAGRAMDKGDVDTALVDLGKGPDMTANIDGEHDTGRWLLTRALVGALRIGANVGAEVTCIP